MSPSGEQSRPSGAQWLQHSSLERPDRVAFAFSGGGPLGALQVGALRALFEHGLRPDLAVGASVGALNATFVSFDPTPEGVGRLDGIWRSLHEDDVFPGGRLKKSRAARMLVRGDHVLDNSGIRGVIAARLGAAAFEAARIPLGIVATDLETGSERLFTSGEVVPPLLASTAMPGIFPPVEIEDRLYIDGGVANNVPIAPAVTLGAHTVYVLDCTGHTGHRRPLNRPIDYLLHAFTLSRAQRLAVEQSLLQERVRLVMLPAAPVDFFVPFASLDHTSRLIEVAYETTSQFLDGDIGSVVEQVQDGAVEAIAPAE